MTTSFDSEMSAFAAGILSGSQLGTTLAYEAVARAYSEATGRTTETVTSHSVQASPPSAVRQWGAEPIEEGDVQTVLPASGLGFTPAAGDRVTLDGESWSVESVQGIRAQDDVVAYKLRLRR